MIRKFPYTFFILFTSLVIFQSCTIQKRLYLKGFYCNSTKGVVNHHKETSEQNNKKQNSANSLISLSDSLTSKKVDTTKTAINNCDTIILNNGKIISCKIISTEANSIYITDCKQKSENVNQIPRKQIKEIKTLKDLSTLTNNSNKNKKPTYISKFLSNKQLGEKTGVLSFIIFDSSLLFFIISFIIFFIDVFYTFHLTPLLYSFVVFSIYFGIILCLVALLLALFSIYLFIKYKGNEKIYLPIIVLGLCLIPFIFFLISKF